MRLERRNLVLGGLLVALSAANFLVTGRDVPTTTVAPLFAALDPDRAHLLRIDAAGRALTLAREEGAWWVQERYGFPAHAGAVNGLLVQLGGLSTLDLVADEAAAHERLGVATGAPRLRVEDAAGTLLVDLLVAPLADGGAGSNVRRTGDSAVFRAATLVPLDADPVRWLDTQLADFDPTGVRVLRVSGPDGEPPLRLVRGENGRWSSGGSSLAPAEVDPLLVAAANLYLQDVLSIDQQAEAGLDAPDLELELELADGERAGLRLGSEGDGGRHAASSSWQEPWVVLLPESSARRIEAAVRRIRSALR